jgi:hypothetical protein
LLKPVDGCLQILGEGHQLEGHGYESQYGYQGSPFKCWWGILTVENLYVYKINVFSYIKGAGIAQ